MIYLQYVAYVALVGLVILYASAWNRLFEMSAGTPLRERAGAYTFMIIIGALLFDLTFILIRSRGCGS